MSSATLPTETAQESVADSSDSTVNSVEITPIPGMDELERFKLYMLFLKMPEGMHVSTGYLHARNPDTIHLADEASCLAHIASIDGDKRKLFIRQLLRIVGS